MIDVAKMTPAEMLALHDRSIGGEPVTDEQRAAVVKILIAASFGSEAFMQHVGCDGGGTIAMLRAFLTALVDPMDPGLDYLRQDPAAAVTARQADAPGTHRGGLSALPGTAHGAPDARS